MVDIKKEDLIKYNNMNLSYSEISKLLGNNYSKSTICRKFKQYNIKHNHPKKQVSLNSKDTISELARKNNCSRRTIRNAIKDLENKIKWNYKFENVDDKTKLFTFNITGHAHYAEYGKDIVCSSVSTLVAFFVNIIPENNSKIYYKGKQIEKIEFSYSNNTYNYICKILVSMLKELSNQYRNNIIEYE